MKRIIALLIASVLLSMILVGCGKPSDVSNEMYIIGETALQVADNYMAYKIDYDAARSKIDKLTEDAQVIYDRNKGTQYSSGDLTLKMLITEMSISMISANYDGVPADIKNERDKLAKYLGK